MLITSTLARVTGELKSMPANSESISMVACVANGSCCSERSHRVRRQWTERALPDMSFLCLRLKQLMKRDIMRLS